MAGTVEGTVEGAVLTFALSGLCRGRLQLSIALCLWHRQLAQPVQKAVQKAVSGTHT